MITTIFCLYCDYIWDWGLFNGDANEKGGRKYLRKVNKMTFPPKFYYFCMVENFLFRFWWFFASTGMKFNATDDYLNKIELIAMIGVLVELTRRWIWTILRV